MKKHLLLAFAICFTFALNAQNKGQSSLGAGVTMDFQNSTLSYYNSFTSESTISFGLGVSGNYFVGNHVQLGAGLSFVTASGSTGVELALGISGYIPITTNFYYTPTLAVALGNIWWQTGGDSFLYGASLGLASFECKVSPKIGISFSALQLVVAATNMDNATKFTTTEVKLGQSSIGINFYL